MNSKKITLECLEAALNASWSIRTCYELMKRDYKRHKTSYGQCYPTTLIVNDYFGGRILSVNFSEGGSHYWNLIKGKEIDLTRDQFDRNQVFPKPKARSRLQITKEHGINQKYLLLKKRVEKLLEEG